MTGVALYARYSSETQKESSITDQFRRCEQRAAREEGWTDLAAADDRNYYLARADPLEQNLRIYRVVKGVRHMLQHFD